MRRAIAVSLVLAVLFTILATWAGFRFIPYWFEPPVGQSLTEGRGAINWALARLVGMQITGFVFGLLLGAVVSFLMRHKPGAIATTTQVTASLPAATVAGSKVSS